MIPSINTIHSVSGRHLGVLIMSDDELVWKESKRLTDALKLVREGGSNGRRSIHEITGSSRKENIW